jgi:hypothetical protein
MGVSCASAELLAAIIPAVNVSGTGFTFYIHKLERMIDGRCGRAFANERYLIERWLAQLNRANQMKMA